MKIRDASTGASSVVDKDRYVEAVLDAVREAVAATAERYEATGATAPSAADLGASIADLVAGADDVNPLVSWVGPFWSGRKVRAELRFASRQALDARRRAHTLLGVKTSDGAVVYPMWQFRRRGTEVEVWPGVAGVLGPLAAHDDWAVAVLFTTPAPELEGLAPIEWIRQGRDDEALRRFAHAVDAEWSR